MANTKEEEEEEEEQDPLKKQFQSLEEDWKCYKESIPRDRRSHSVVSLELLLSTSPKKLISSLQQCHSPRAKTNNIRGRSLLEELENVKDDGGGDDDDDVVFNEASPTCSVCSSVLSEENGPVSCSCLSHDGSGSSSASLDSMREEEVDEKLESRSGEERWMMRMVWVPVTVLVALLGVIFMMVGFGGEECGEYVTPT
ncbi:uncharacterized protein A4U43_C02F10920 [Asparagus officinalis]|uniref:Uncharacterized protein n=1 Tax=Asparagus officinalis TaxID=4686 RepID=A0A5P1FLH7_ASPOF|nr:uncharacterized protein A4U43_C02F10920 [Asparagus officinalis]